MNMINIPLNRLEAKIRDSQHQGFKHRLTTVHIANIVMDLVVSDI